MPDIVPPPSPDNHNSSPIFAMLRGIHRDNAGTRLLNVTCPLCRTGGWFELFTQGPNVGIVCQGCGAAHPFREFGLVWLPTEQNAWRTRRRP